MTDLLKPAVRRFRSNLALTAGAGAGKTTTLVEFYVSLVMGQVGDLEPIDCARILAVTYTNKAAQELKDRIRQKMTERLNISSGDRADRLARELDRLEQAPVGTIHGFCSGLLREHALEAGIDPGFVIAEGRELLTEAVFGTVIKLLDQADPDATLLIKHLPFGDSNGGLISTLIYSLNLGRSMGYSPDWMAGQINSGQAEFDKLRSDNARQFFQAINALGQVQVSPKIKTYQALQEVVAKAYDQPLTEELADWLEARLGQLRGKANEPKKKLKEVIQTWRLLEAEPLGRELGLALARLLVKVDQAYTEIKQNQGCLDHDDLQLLARDLLFGNLEVRRRVKDRLQLIIVDESQDANPLQWQIINCLREVRNEHRPLTPDQDPAVELNLDDRRLLVVGDVKQSIYRFRGAEVADFRNMVDRFDQGSGGEVCCLDHNYRSQPGLVDFFNAFFDRCFGPAQENYQAAYTKADCQACHRPGQGAGLVELLVSPAKSESSALTQLEAEAVATRLAQLINDQPEALLTDQRPGLLWSHLAVLFRTMAQMAPFEAAFRRRGIPYRVVKSGGGLDEPEIIDLVNLLEYLTRPDDRLLLASLLRSPLVGLDDDSLAGLALGDEPSQGLERFVGPAAQARPTGLPVDQLAKLERFNELICSLLKVKDRLAPADLISLAMEQTDLAAVYLAGFQGDQKLARIKSLIETVRRLNAREAPLLSDVVERLRPLTSQPATDVEPPADSDLDAVTLMTIHKAKGLQFPVAVVARSGRTRRPPEPIILARPGLGLGLKFKQPGKTGWRQTWSHSRLLGQERSREEAENKRLFYVAATRAEDLLIFSGMRESKKDDSSWRAQLENFAANDDCGLTQTIALKPETGRSAHFAGPIKPLIPDEAVERVVDRVFSRPDCGQLLEYSVSQLEDLDLCPRLFLLQRLIGRPVRGRAADPGLNATNKGIWFHKVMEEINFSAPGDLESLARDQAACLGLNPSPAEIGQIASAATGLLADDLGQTLARVPADDQHRELSMSLNINLDQGNRLIVNGEIDLLAQVGQELWLVDYKLARPGEGYDFQLMTYGLAASLSQAGVLPRLLIVYAHEGRVTVKEVPFGEEQREEIWQRLKSVGQKLIQAGDRLDRDAWPDLPGGPADHCPYFGREGCCG